MLRLTAILLSSLMLLQSFHLGIADLVQLDELMEHARFHQQEYGDSFLTFLAKHYGDQKQEHEREHQEEHPEHEQLPFQHLPQQLLGHTHYFLAQRFSWKTLPENQESQLHLFYYHLRSPGTFVDGIFQPPRFS